MAHALPGVGSSAPPTKLSEPAEPSAAAARPQRQSSAPAMFVPEPEANRRASLKGSGDAAGPSADFGGGGAGGGGRSGGGGGGGAKVDKKISKEAADLAKAEAKAAKAAEKAAEAAAKAAEKLAQARKTAAKAAAKAAEAARGVKGGGGKTASGAGGGSGSGKAAASGSKPKPAAPPPAAVLLPGHSFNFGDEVEVEGHEEGYEGSWYMAEVVVANQAAEVCVQYDALYDEETNQPLKEWLVPQLLRPAPPPPPADWASRLVAGAPLELSHDDGWWQVSFLGMEAGGDGGDGATAQFKVQSVQWGKEHLVDGAVLRPGWEFRPATQTWGQRGEGGGAAGGGSRGGGGGRSRGRGRGRGRGRR